MLCQGWRQEPLRAMIWIAGLDCKCRFEADEPTEIGAVGGGRGRARDSGARRSLGFDTLLKSVDEL